MTTFLRFAFNSNLVLISVLISKCLLSYTQDIKKVPFAIGETVQLRSEILNETRTLNIYLPLGYSPDSSKTYAVIYLLDGSADEDIIHIAGLVQFFSFPWINIMPETIVVGIANVDRKRDFTSPTEVEKDLLDYPTTGHSSEFIDFLEKEIIPFVEKNYKTGSGKTIIGQSLGGLLATEILFFRPEMFDNYFIISPSLWWNNEYLLDKEMNFDLSGKSIYIAVGKEGKLMVGPSKKLYKILKSMKAPDTQLYFQYFKDKTHGDVLHQAIYEGFVKMFNPQVD